MTKEEMRLIAKDDLEMLNNRCIAYDKMMEERESDEDYDEEEIIEAIDCDETLNGLDQMSHRAVGLFLSDEKSAEKDARKAFEVIVAECRREKHTLQAEIDRLQACLEKVDEHLKMTEKYREVLKK